MTNSNVIVAVTRVFVTNTTVIAANSMLIMMNSMLIAAITSIFMTNTTVFATFTGVFASFTRVFVAFTDVFVIFTLVNITESNVKRIDTIVLTTRIRFPGMQTLISVLDTTFSLMEKTTDKALSAVFAWQLIHKILQICMLEQVRDYLSLK
jgi:drug/metabolite transporter superfamily protein YnfA